MSNKLTTISPTYNSFVPDQVLTDTQLNGVINYFEDQDRLSRICLSGVGIVCGFQLSYERTKSIDLIRLTQGSGITTDGDLLHLLGTKIEENGDQLSPSIEIPDIELTGYVSYTDSEKHYTPYFHKDQGGSLVEFGMFELLPTNNDVVTTPITTEFAQNKVFILYLDCYSNEPGACTAITCDSQGKEEVRQLRVLAVDLENKDHILQHDNMYSSYHALADYLGLKNVIVPRVLLNSINTHQLDTLINDYGQTIVNGSNLQNLVDGFTVMMNKWGLDDNVSAMQNALNTVFSPSNFSAIYFQYKYDMFKDIVDSYNELKQLFLKQAADCCPDIRSFPKHLLLGKVQIPLEIGEIKNIVSENYNDLEFRHEFYKSPILLEDTEIAQRAKSIIIRVAASLSNFIGNTLTNNEIRITPSNLRVNLGKRAIPFYYNHNQLLHKNWDFDRSKYGEYKNILGYQQASQPSSSDYVKRPLLYNTDQHDFYRIEGHQGLKYQTAFDLIDQQRKQLNLPFDIKVLGINVEESAEISPSDYRCEFQDLNVLLKAWTAEQECILGQVTSLLSAFSTQDQGDNINEDDFITFQPVEPVLPTPVVFDPGILDPGTTDPFDPKDPFSPYNPYNPYNPYDPNGPLVNPGGPSYNFPGTTTPDYGNIDFGGALGGDNLKPTIGNTQPTYNMTGAKSVSPEPTAGATNTSVDTTAGKTNSSLAEGKFAVVKPNSDNPVIGNLAVNDGTIGSLIFDAIGQSSGNSSSDILAFYDQAISTIPGIKDWPEPVSEATVGLPAKIIASCYAITNLLPGSLEELTYTSLTDYKTEINKLCSYSKKLQSVYGDSQVKLILSEKLMGMVDLLNNQLTTVCCSSKKLQALLKEVEDRKLMILQRIKFASFAADHPGLEHKAGVQPGGTFVMVYVFAKNSIGGRFGVPSNTVIADFALPYMCCSDCAPINFMVPKEIVSLSLPTDTFCLDGDVTSLEFKVSPVDGEIKPQEPIAGLVIDGTTLTIDKTLFPAEEIGKPIKFTVNDQYTECTIVVREQPTAGITYKQDEQDPLTIEFGLSEQPSNVDFTWDFGDGSAPVTTAFPTHTYSYPLADGGNTVTVTLMAAPKNGACPAIVTEEITLPEIEVKIDKANTILCEDDDPVAFTITPVGAQPKLEGAGIVFKNGTYFFDPSKTTPEEEPFEVTMDGTVIETFTVNRIPQVKLLVDHMGLDFVAFTSTIKFADTFTWRFLDNNKNDVIPPIVDDPSPKVELADLQGHKTIYVLLEATNAAACDTGSDSTEFIVPTIKEKIVTLEKYKFCSNDFNPYVFKTEGYTEKPLITGPGVDSGKLTFTPALAGVGKHAIDVNSGENSITVIVTQGPEGGLHTELLPKDGIIHIEATNLQGVEAIRWEFYNNGNLILSDRYENEKIIDLYAEKLGVKGGDSVLVRMILLSSTCERSIVEQVILIPGGDNNNGLILDDPKITDPTNPGYVDPNKTVSGNITTKLD